MNIRAIVFIACGVLIFALAAAGTATPVGTYSTSMMGFSISASLSLWEVCTKSPVSDTCTSSGMTSGCAGGIIVAARAFSVMTCLVCLVVPLAGVADFLGKIPTLPIPTKFALAVLPVPTALFSLIAWAMGFGLLNNSCNGRSLSDMGYGSGPMQPLLIVVTILAIAASIAAIVAPAGTEAGGAVTKDSDVSAMMQPMTSAQPARATRQDDIIDL